MNAETRAKATPEQQAKLIVESLRGRQDGWQWAEHVITQALRQAENEARAAALEEAAAFLDDRYDPRDPIPVQGWEIRSLIQKD